MKPVSLRGIIIGCACAIMALGCGTKTEAPTPEEHALSGQGDPPAHDAPPYVPPTSDFTLGDAGCCPVRFAIASQGEVAVSLFGFAPPLQDGVAMTLDAGAWETTVCMGLSTQVYGYREYVQPDDPDAGVFELVTYNPNAPTVASSEYGLLNEFRAPEDGGTCADLDVAPHGDTTVPDSGS